MITSWCVQTHTSLKNGYNQILFANFSVKSLLLCSSLILIAKKSGFEKHLNNLNGCIIVHFAIGLPIKFDVHKN